MRQFSTVILLPPGGLDAHSGLNLAGRTALEWVQDQAAAAGQDAAILRTGQASPSEAGENLLCLDGTRPLLLAQTIETLVARHLESGAEVTLLLAGDGETVTAANLCGACFNSAWLESAALDLLDLARRALAADSRVSIASPLAPVEQLSMRSLPEIAQCEKELRKRVNGRAMESGVRLIDPDTTYIDATTTLEPETTVHPNCHIKGQSRIGRGCEVGPNAIIIDSVLGASCRVAGATIERSALDRDVLVGPYSHVRDGAEIGEAVHIGNYAEIKNSRVGPRTRMHHFGYIGDADVGSDVNIGAGTITCNFDGVNKHRTIIGDGAFIGSDTMLVAPVSVGERARTGAGSVVNRDVPAGGLAVGVPARLRRTATREVDGQS